MEAVGPQRRVVRVPGRARAGGDRKREESIRRHFPLRAPRASPSALRLCPGRAPGSAGLGARPQCCPPPGWASCTAWGRGGRPACCGTAEREGAECVYKIPRLLPAVGTEGPGSAAERPPAPSACVSAASSSGVDAAQASLDPAKAPSTRTGAGGGEASLTFPGRGGQRGRCQVFISLGLLPYLPGVRVQPVQ